jgi:hypothetical protein
MTTDDGGSFSISAPLILGLGAGMKKLHVGLSAPNSLPILENRLPCHKPSARAGESAKVTSFTIRLNLTISSGLNLAGWF